jgi:hypothetical protein
LLKFPIQLYSVGLKEEVEMVVLTQLSSCHKL